MPQTSEIRNVALIGHRGAGKTSLVEALLHAAGVINRMGTVPGGNTVTDFDDEEQKRGLSIGAAVAGFVYKGTRINLIDTPGYADFLGETYGALRVADAAILVLHAESGVEVETDRVWQWTEEFNLPVLAVINHQDAERADYDRVLAQLTDRLGARTARVGLPTGPGSGFSGVLDLVGRKLHPGGQTGVARGQDVPSEFAEAVETGHGELAEFAAENDEALMEKYFEAGELASDDLLSGLRAGVGDRSLVPVTAAAATQNIGTLPLLDLIVALLPSPAERPAVQGTAPNGETITREPSPDAPFAGYCFKAIQGESRKITLLRVWSGKAHAGDTMLNTSQNERERLGTIGRLVGERFEDVEDVVAGDIIGLVKVDARTGDTLAAESAPIVFEPTAYPEPLMTVAVHPKSRGDDERIGQGLSQLNEEDPSFRYRRNEETGELLLSGMGDMHLGVILERLKDRYKAEVDTTKPKIAYRETVRGTAQAQGRYKKQTGGSGQFGDVFLRIEPRERGAGFEFKDEIFGGKVPRQYIPSVEKGVQNRLVEGFMAGFPMVDVTVALVDGSYHAVDSSDIAFQLAGKMALETCAKDAGVYLLEPVMDIWVTVPDDYVGDIMGDLPRRRGLVMGTDSTGGMTTVQARVPEAELATYATDLRSMTQGRGSFRIALAGYEEVPGELAQRIQDERRQEKEEARR